MEKILFFDGLCVMCNSLVDFVLKYDKKHSFKLAPLQGSTAQRLIPDYAQGELNTIVLLDEEGVHTESDAIIRLFIGLGSYFRLAILWQYFPKNLRDAAYRYVAKNRYRWFGKRDQCRLPSPEERKQLLD